MGSAGTPAIVVVFRDVAGIFQDVSITPSNNESTTSTTVRNGPTLSDDYSDDHSNAGGISPVAATQPGTGWGGD